MSIGSWFGAGKKTSTFASRGPSTINGKPITDPGPGPGSTPDKPTPPPSTTVAASEAIGAATTAAGRQRKRAAAGAPLVGGPVAMPPGGVWSERFPTAKTTPRTLLGGK